MKRRLTIALVALVVVVGSAYYIARFHILETRNMERLNDVKGDYKTLSDGFVYYQVEGANKNGIVIFIHGGGATGSYVWRKNFQYLVDHGYQIVLFDLYDRGYSERLNEANTLGLFNNQFEELINSLNIVEPFHIVSLSMGCMIGVTYANKYPERVKSFCMISPAVLGGYSNPFAMKLPVVKDLLMTFYWSPRAVENQKDEFYAPDKYPEYFRQLEKFKKYRGYIKTNMTTWQNIQTLNLSTEIKSLKTPTLSIFGRHDPYVPPHIEKLFNKLNDNIKTTVIEEAGHMPNYEQSDEVNQIILSFIQGQTRN